VSTITTKIKLMQPPITTLLAFGYTMHGNSISILSNLEAIMPETHRGPLVPRGEKPHGQVSSTISGPVDALQELSCEA
jgi:hypothetical protein